MLSNPGFFGLFQIHHSDKFNGVPYGLFLGPKVGDRPVSHVFFFLLLFFCGGNYWWFFLWLTPLLIALTDSLFWFLVREWAETCCDAGARGSWRARRAGEGDQQENQIVKGLGIVARTGRPFLDLEFSIRVKNEWELSWMIMKRKKHFWIRCFVYFARRVRSSVFAGRSISSSARVLAILIRVEAWSTSLYEESVFLLSLGNSDMTIAHGES